MLGACQKQVSDPAIAILPESMHIGVVGFTQPTSTSALLTGTLPKMQGLIDAEGLISLDNYLIVELNKTARPYTLIPTSSKINRIDAHESQTPQALKKWLEFGKAHNLEILLVPQVLNWNERDGSNIGADSSAHIKLGLYLLDIKNDRIFDIALFEEKQIGLSDNLLNVGSFLKRSGAWITADEMAKEAIVITVQELKI